MDSFTHLVAGALTPVIFKNTPKRAALITFGILAGEFPDIDVFFGSTPEAFMTVHRGITHALAVQPLTAFCLAFPFWLWLRKKRNTPPMAGFLSSFLGLWLAALIALYMHVFLDSMTTFGTQIWLPFSDARVAEPAMFIVDFLCTLPSCILLVLALLAPPAAPALALGGKVFSARAILFARLGFGWLIVYPLLCLGINAGLTAYIGTLPYAAASVHPTGAVESAQASPGKEKGSDIGPRISLLTEPFSPFVWKLVIDEGSSWRIGTVFITSLSHEPQWSRYRKADPALLHSLEEQSTIFTHFRKFCSLLVQEEVQSGQGTEADTRYVFKDLRYIVTKGSLLRAVGRGDTPFVLEAQLASDGRLKAWRFLHRDTQPHEEKTPWEPVNAVQ